MLLNTAVILAGGRSSRMGFDKQFIKVRGRLIVEHQVELLRKLFEEIIIVTNKPEEYKNCNCKLAADELPDFGPLGGIHAGLKASNSLYSYYIACDMPNLNTEYILFIRDKIQAAEPKPQAVITRFGNWVEPFNAYYSKDLIPVILQAYEERQMKISSVLQKSEVLYIPEATARSFSPNWDMFANINTIEDLSKFK